MYVYNDSTGAIVPYYGSFFICFSDRPHRKTYDAGCFVTIPPHGNYVASTWVLRGKLQAEQRYGVVITNPNLGWWSYGTKDEVICPEALEFWPEKKKRGLYFEDTWVAWTNDREVPLNLTGWQERPLFTVLEDSYGRWQGGWDRMSPSRQRWELLLIRVRKVLRRPDPWR